MIRDLPVPLTPTSPAGTPREAAEIALAPVPRAQSAFARSGSSPLPRPSRPTERSCVTDSRHGVMPTAPAVRILHRPRRGFTAHPPGPGAALRRAVNRVRPLPQRDGHPAHRLSAYRYSPRITCKPALYGALVDLLMTLHEPPVATAARRVAEPPVRRDVPGNRAPHCEQRRTGFLATSQGSRRGPRHVGPGVCARQVGEPVPGRDGVGGGFRWSP